MNSPLRLVEAPKPMTRADGLSPHVSVLSAREALREAESRLVAMRAQADDLRRVGQDGAAERMEAGAVAEAYEALEAAERSLFAAPVRSIEDLAEKIVVAAQSEFECPEANDALLRDSEAILRAARSGV